MGTVVLLSCTKQKSNKATIARDMYLSPLFRYELKYSELLNSSDIFILSAKYKLIGLNEVIEPYDVTLNNMNREERKKWATEVIDELSQCTNLSEDHYIFLAGAKYREFLIPKMTNYSVPMEGLSIGKQLQFLRRKLHEH